MPKVLHSVCVSASAEENVATSKYKARVTEEGKQAADAREDDHPGISQSGASQSGARVDDHPRFVNQGKSR